MIVFFIVVVLYISFRFEWKMALAAFIAVIHDLLVTAGIYSLFGFQVTPDTVIAILTILGYSLYDTVVVFDRIRESTRGLGASGRMTYEDVVNLSMNQVLARSINTSLVAILPVLSVLVIGAEILGASTLQYFGLALVIGLTSGAYSSIFIASPILVQLKEREPRYVALRQKSQNRDTRGRPAHAGRRCGHVRRGRRDEARRRPGLRWRRSRRAPSARRHVPAPPGTAQVGCEASGWQARRSAQDRSAGDGVGAPDTAPTNGGDPGDQRRPAADGSRVRGLREPGAPRPQERRPPGVPGRAREGQRQRRQAALSPERAIRARSPR